MTPKKTLVSKKRRLTRSSVDHEELSSSTHVSTATSTATSTPQIPTPISNPTPTQIPILTLQGSSTPTPNQIPTPTLQGSSTPTIQVPTTMGESNFDSDLGDNDELSLLNRRGRNLNHPEDHPKQGERFKVE